MGVRVHRHQAGVGGSQRPGLGDRRKCTVPSRTRQRGGVQTDGHQPGQRDGEPMGPGHWGELCWHRGRKIRINLERINCSNFRIFVDAEVINLKK